MKKITVSHGYYTTRPMLHGRCVEVEWPLSTRIWWRIKSVFRCLAIGALIILAVIAAAINPEAFSRGFVTGVVGYSVARSILR